MHIYILAFDDSVEVTEPFNIEPYYVSRNYPKGQIFHEKRVGNGDYWCVLHRDYKGNGPSWVYTERIPKEVLFARMLAD